MTSPTTEITDLARRFRVDIDMGTHPTEDWQQLYGIEELKPIFEQRMEGDEGYDDDGGNRDAITGSAERLEITLKRRRDAAGNWNTVHEYLRLKSRAANSITGEIHVRWYDREGRGEAYEARAIVTWTPNGGNGGARDTIALVIRVQGRAEEITNPLANPDPVVTSLTPATGDEAGGEQILLRGANLGGATDVDFGANAATSFVVIDDTRIVAVAPAGTAGTVQVTVTTPEGTSSTSGSGNDYVYTA